MSRAFLSSLAAHAAVLLALLLAAAVGPRPAKASYPRSLPVRLIAAPHQAAPAAAEPAAAVEPPPKQAAKQAAEAIRRTAAPAQKQGPVLPPGMKILAAEGAGDEGSYYLGVIMAKISRYWNNPYQGGQGELRTRVYFRIGRGGEVETVEIEQPSGNAVFDQAGLRAVLLARSFPPLPPEITAPSLGVHFEFEYLR